jgi:XTP/dITP diphosphohydrolase
MQLTTSYSKSFQRMQQIMDDLRAQCPWDKKQTIESLRPLSIEEMYELVDAISAGDWKGIKEELGDLLLHIFFYAKIASEQNEFGIEDVLEHVCNKLVHRHPHIYDNIKVENEEDVKRNWENLKLKEGKKSILAGVPNSLPAMVKALRLQEKAKQVGFEWENAKQVEDKVNEEMNELAEAIHLQNQDKMEDEFGDVLFSMVNYARFLNIDPEHALARTNQKFKNRFQKMEDLLTQGDRRLSDHSLAEMDATWNEVKKYEHEK